VRSPTQTKATSLVAALLALLLGSLSPVLAQDFPPASADAPSRTGRRALTSTLVWEFPLDEIPAAPVEKPELFETDYGHGIVLQGTPEYVAGMSELLDSMALLPSGSELLEALGETGYSTTISALPRGVGPSARPADPAAATFVIDAEGNQLPGPGSDALVYMDPTSTLPLTSAEIVLGHELLHALHYHQGERLNVRQTEGPNAGTKLEELRTIGTDGFDDEELSENELREEWNELYPDDPVPPERNGHGATAFGPSRTGPGKLIEIKLIEPLEPREVKPLRPLDLEPITPPELQPVTIQPDPAQDAEGAARVLQRRLGGR
tara:strand:+ start:614 stop:1576 length:963 start_codon:yes stop_codon:yes gene_type:complete